MTENFTLDLKDLVDVPGSTGRSGETKVEDRENGVYDTKSV